MQGAHGPSMMLRGQTLRTDGLHRPTACCFASLCRSSRCLQRLGPLTRAVVVLCRAVPCHAALCLKGAGAHSAVASAALPHLWCL